MAKVLGYGGVANTNGARSFAGKAAAAVEAAAVVRPIRSAGFMVEDGTVMMR